MWSFGSGKHSRTRLVDPPYWFMVLKALDHPMAALTHRKQSGVRQSTMRNPGEPEPWYT